MPGRLLAGALAIAALLCPPALAAAADPPASVTLDGTARDFRGWDLSPIDDLPRGHVDFENASGYETGIVGLQLGPDGLPVYAKEGRASATTHGRAAFDQWFRDRPLVNVSEPIALTLTRQPNGTYRYSDTSFFPLDGSGWVGQGRETARTDGGGPHNFSFSVELHSEFAYDGSGALLVTGDDDIFVFVNDRLALDLGGVHGPLSGLIDLAAGAADLGLAPGRLADLDVFVAERHTSASNFMITTPRLGFDAGTATISAASPTIVGDPLTCSAGGWHDDVTLSYAWLRDGVAIDGADDPSYTANVVDAGSSISCRITGSRTTTASATSEPVAVFLRGDPPPPWHGPPPPWKLPPPWIPPAPNVSVTEQPNPLTRSREVRVVFVTDANAASYECRLDGGAWQTCTTPYVLRGLRAGDHAIAIRAVTADGRRGPEATRAFQVNPYAPQVVLARAKTLRVSRGGVVPVRVTCSAREGEGRGNCSGTVALRHTSRAGGRGRGRAVTRTLGRARFSAGAARTATVRVRLTRAARRLLAAAPRRGTSVRVVLDVRDLAGNRGQLSFARTLRAG